MKPSKQKDLADRIPGHYKLLILRDRAVAKGNTWVWLFPPSWR